MPTEDEQDKARKYHDYLPPNFHCVGRNGTYRYSVDIDDCIEQAFFVADLIKNSKWENAVPMEKHRMKNFSSMGKQ